MGVLRLRFTDWERFRKLEKDVFYLVFEDSLVFYLRRVIERLVGKRYFLEEGCGSRYRKILVWVYWYYTG